MDMALHRVQACWSEYCSQSCSCGAWSWCSDLDLVPGRSEAQQHDRIRCSDRQLWLCCSTSEGCSTCLWLNRKAGPPSCVAGGYSATSCPLRLCAYDVLLDGAHCLEPILLPGTEQELQPKASSDMLITFSLWKRHLIETALKDVEATLYVSEPPECRQSIRAC